MGEKELWERCVAFHGHECGGLMIGFKAALYAQKLLEVRYSKDEDLVCITENDACGVDAIQVLLGCSVGKGNLLFRLRGKQAFNIFNRTTGKAVRLVLKETDELPREEKLARMRESRPEDLFDVKEPSCQIPIRAKIFGNIYCEKCREKTSENMIRIQEGKKVCLDCWQGYSRFLD